MERTVEWEVWTKGGALVGTYGDKEFATYKAGIADHTNPDNAPHRIIKTWYYSETTVISTKGPTNE